MINLLCHHHHPVTKLRHMLGCFGFKAEVFQRCSERAHKSSAGILEFVLEVCVLPFVEVLKSIISISVKFFY